MALAPSLPQVLELDLAARIPGRPILPSHLAWSQFSRPGNWSAVSRPYWLDRSWWPAVLIRLRSVYSAQHVGEAACVIVRLQRRAAAAAGSDGCFSVEALLRTLASSRGAPPAPIPGCGLQSLCNSASGPDVVLRSAETKPTRMADHRYGSNRSPDPPIWDFPGLRNMGGSGDRFERDRSCARGH